MVVIAFAALLAAAPMQTPQVPPAPQTAPQTPPGEEPADLGEIEVTGRPLDTMIRSFVNEVAEPNNRRGLARWDDRICIGVANLRAEPAQYIIDRVSTVAEDLGVIPGEPGCTPNVIIVASADPDALARQLVEERRQAFRMGGSGMDRGGDALGEFVSSDAPVRWWQVSMPTDAETGGRATRIPGECRNSCDNPLDMAPIVQVFAASRLQTQIVDYIFRTVVILDIDQVGRVSGQQLADYVAMVTLAQIDPDADTSRYASILNVFDTPDAADGLTAWDQAYLNGLYDAERTRKNLRAGRTEIADSIHRAHNTLQDEEAE
ncbi:hypothetical protein GGQ87_002417 [Brevundimonas alba]|uniref:DUF2927 domain-containing protein n=1 Tax=Brevundimonas alba TaxID=74314 RepID=A0A7X5YM22_9CAUL|nr:hypothetical protein [Brevundimonas alba]NJC42122.1 hypothetical protein [Brevundimonas alba]